MVKNKERSYILSGELYGINDDYNFEHVKWRTEFKSRGPEQDGWLLFDKTFYQLTENLKELNDKEKGS